MPDVRSAFHIIFQSTLSVRRATQKFSCINYQLFCISIHALREESDTVFFVDLGLNLGFQSTLSVRRATDTRVDTASAIFRISIHALREESDRAYSYFFMSLTISIHALREESDNIRHCLKQVN